MRTPRHVATLLCVATLFACSSERTSDLLAPARDVAGAPQLDVSGRSAGPRASGHANWLNQFQDVVRRSFNAVEQKDGVVVGSFVQHNVSGFFAKGEINCLQILGSNEAVLSGPVRKSSIADLVGRTGIFRVGDGGEGNDDDPPAVDRSSNLVVQPTGSTVDCKTFVNPAFYLPIQSGNIQVEP
jgi:hypothetical protein